MQLLQQGLEFYSVEEAKDEGTLTTSAEEPEERCGKMEKGVERFMAKWHR